MAEVEEKSRFLTGKISRCSLAEPREFTSKVTGDRWKAYTCHIDGFFEDTDEAYEGYFQSGFRVHVYDGGDDPIDPSTADGKIFNGRILVKQKGEKFYLNAVSIEEILGDERKPATNPFKDNPYMG